MVFTQLQQYSTRLQNWLGGFWSIKYRIEDLLHYLDDFIMAAPANSVVCASNLQVAVAVVARLDLPLHPQNCLGPASCMMVLGMELDTAAQIAHLPYDMFSALKDALSHWSTCK